MAYRTGELDYVLWKMASLSQLAHGRLSDEVFRAHMDHDEDTPLAIVNDVQETFLADMREIGIFLACPTTDLTSGQDTTLWFLDLLEWVLPTSLYLIMRRDTTVVAFMRSLVGGSITDGDLLPHWLEWVADHNPELRNAVDYYRDRLISSALFDNCFNSMIDDLDQEMPAPVMPHIQHVRTVADFFHRIHDKLAVLKDSIPDLPDHDVVFAGVEQKIKDYELSCLYADTVDMTGWWLETDYRKLPISQREYYRSVSTKISCACPMLPGFYSIRGQVEFDQITEHSLIITTLLFSQCSGRVDTGPFRSGVFAKDTALFDEVQTLLKD